MSRDISEWAYDSLAKVFVCLHGSMPPGFPSFDHCVGTGRWLGTLYSSFVAESSEIRSPFFWRRLTELFSSLRAEIVIHDHLLDKSVTGEWGKVGWSLRDEYLAYAVTVAVDLLGSAAKAERIISDSLSNIDRGYSLLKAGGHPCLDIIVLKCNHIMVPLEVLRLLDPRFLHEPFALATKRYLFTLQCADDFYDVVEDYYSEMNHNLYVWSLNPERFSVFLANRPKLMPAMSLFLATHLESTAENLDAVGAKKLTRLFHATTAHLKKSAIASGLRNPGIWGGPSHLEDYFPPVHCWEDYNLLCAMLSGSASASELSEFRAEMLHGISSVIE